MSKYDMIVIGSGPGGYVAAIRASQLGMKVGVVEKAELGGICLNWGCIPTKALLKSAQVFEDIKHAKEFGIEASGKPDFPAVIKRSRGVADKMSKGVQFLMRKNKIDVISGVGKVISKNEITVKGSDGKTATYQAKYIVLATGARARELPNLPIDGKKIIGYREAMVLPEQPKSIIIVGSGAIGVEFAYFYNSIGTKVTVVEYLPRIVPVEDEDISKELEKAFKKKGIEIITNASVEKADVSATGVKATIKKTDGSGEQVLEADILLSAVGIVTNLENIGIEELGIKTERGKVLVDEGCKTNIDNIYAIGDIIPGPALADKAMKEAVICAEAIAFKESKYDHQPTPLDYGNMPACTYTGPEIASVGLTEKQAREAGMDIKVGKFPLMASGKASAVGATDGFVKVIFDAKYGEWIGTHMIGYNVTELIAQTTTARKLETTWHEQLDTIFPHPTMSEAIKDAIEDALGEAIHL